MLPVGPELEAAAAPTEYAVAAIRTQHIVAALSSDTFDLLDILRRVLMLNDVVRAATSFPQDDRAVTTLAGSMANSFYTPQCDCDWSKVE